MIGFSSAYAHGAVIEEGVDRHLQVARRRAAADTARSIVVRAVARAEPAAIVAPRVARLLPERDAAQMRAYADQDQPFGILRPRLIRLRVRQLVQRHGAG